MIIEVTQDHINNANEYTADVNSISLACLDIIQGFKYSTHDGIITDTNEYKFGKRLKQWSTNTTNTFRKEDVYPITLELDERSFTVRIKGHLKRFYETLKECEEESLKWAEIFAESIDVSMDFIDIKIRHLIEGYYFILKYSKFIIEVYESDKGVHSYCHCSLFIERRTYKGLWYLSHESF